MLSGKVDLDTKKGKFKVVHFAHEEVLHHQTEGLNCARNVPRRAGDDVDLGRVDKVVDLIVQPVKLIMRTN